MRTHSPEVRTKLPVPEPAPKPQLPHHCQNQACLASLQQVHAASRQIGTGCSPCWREIHQSSSGSLHPGLAALLLCWWRETPWWRREMPELSHVLPCQLPVEVNREVHHSRQTARHEIMVAFCTMLRLSLQMENPMDEGSDQSAG